MPLCGWERKLQSIYFVHLSNNAIRVNTKKQKMKQRNVFLSFLGNRENSMTRYSSDDLDNEVATRFVQVATIKSIQRNFREGDKLIIFTTQGSMKNWNGDSTKTGLHKELQNLNLSCEIENIRVENGNTQEEIWDIFQTIFDTLENNDKLFVDITSGFRSLPLLILPLINYAKFLKDITVAKISYAYYDNTKAVNPIYDLTDFSKLQDWTNNANIFLRTGNAQGLAQQIEEDTFKDVKEGLERFSEFTLVNRGMDIYKGSEIVNLARGLDELKVATASAQRAVIPILNKVKDQFNGYQENSALNGFHAVRWCIDNGLIQQAATLLEEFIITYLMDLIGDEKKTSSVTRAVILSFAKRGPDIYQYGTRANYPLEKEKKICADLSKITELASIGAVAKVISDKVRNDVNHAGFRKKPGPKSYAEIRAITIEQFNNLCDVLAARGHQIEKITD
jgi:CRISPR-associated Csx2 family protein